MAYPMGEAKPAPLRVDLSSLRSFSSNRPPPGAGISRQQDHLGRRPAATAGADMTSCVIAATGLNRRVRGSRHLPNERLQIADCTLAGSPTHRVPYLKTPIWIVGARFRSIRDCVTVFGAWEEPSGKSRLNASDNRNLNF